MKRLKLYRDLYTRIHELTVSAKMYLNSLIEVGIPSLENSLKSTLN